MRRGWVVFVFGALVMASCSEHRPHEETGPSTFTLSGSVSGAEGVTIRVRGPEERTVTTGPQGAWTIPALKPGVYVVTPSQPGFVFQPMETEVRIHNADVPSITFVRQQPTEGLSPADAARLDTMPDTWPWRDTSSTAVGPPASNR